MLKNFKEIYDFGDEWRDTTNFSVSPEGNFLFTALISYKSELRGIERENCTVHIFRNGMSDGDISIYSKGILQAETHHLGFNAKWQTYKYDKNDNAIVVTGNSAKMGGDYSVRISPNGTKPSFY